MATPCGRNALFKAVALLVVVVSCAVCSAGFCAEDAHGVELRERLWTKTQLNAERSGLCSAKWMAAEAADCTKVEFAAPFSDGTVPCTTK